MNLPTNWDLRAAVALALLALLPVAAYLVLQDVVVALSLVSVLVIGLALFLMFSPSEAEVRPTKG